MNRLRHSSGTFLMSQKWFCGRTGREFSIFWLLALKPEDDERLSITRTLIAACHISLGRLQFIGIGVDLNNTPDAMWFCRRTGYATLTPARAGALWWTGILASPREFPEISFSLSFPSKISSQTGTRLAFPMKKSHSSSVTTTAWSTTKQPPVFVNTLVLFLFSRGCKLNLPHRRNSAAWAASSNDLFIEH